MSFALDSFGNRVCHAFVIAKLAMHKLCLLFVHNISEVVDEICAYGSLKMEGIAWQTIGDKIP